MIIHISGHFASVNSKGPGIARTSMQIRQILKVASSEESNGSNEPNGVLEELAAIPYMPMVLAPKSESSHDDSS